MTSPKRVRCAIYTRVSTEQGLDMDFNSLDAQREACDAYIRSQKHEGWQPVADIYDDGGYSGGTLVRPDLARLMADIRARKLDVIVVYKVDRLTRSLADFAKLVELFDSNGVSFVSVTQAFNTTTSMGRLTLNVLLSFAQFEREVTAERIRDKIAASKRKGIRMGGSVPLGYVLKDKRLVPNEAEAADVRRIFDSYLACGSLTALLRELDRSGIRTKRSVGRDGGAKGGHRFGKGSLRYLLINRVYVGDIGHKGTWYRSEHPPIVDPDTFEAVQQALNSSRDGRKMSRKRLLGLFALAGRIFDDRGNRMSPTLARKGASHYRYYVSCVLAQGRRAEAGSLLRASAAEVEATLLSWLSHRSNIAGPQVKLLLPVLEDDSTLANSQQLDETFCLIERVEVGRDRLRIRLHGDPATTVHDVLWTPSTHRRKHQMLTGSTPVNARADVRARHLLRTVGKARQWVSELSSGKVSGIDALAKREGVTPRSIRQTLELAFLAPSVVKTHIAAVEMASQ